MGEVFLTVIVTLVGAQLTKMMIKKDIYFKHILTTGGMPSTHAALVSALLMSMFLEEGFSKLTAICFTLFIIVVIDAFGVRRTAGEEGKAINKIIKREKIKLRPLKFALGHEPEEVMMGIIFGFIISLMLYFL